MLLLNYRIFYLTVVLIKVSAHDGYAKYTITWGKPLPEGKEPKRRITLSPVLAH